MATLKQQFTAFASITITLGSLGAGLWRQSVFVDNSTNLFLSAKLMLKVKTGATAAGNVGIWLYASADDSTTVFSDGANGTDAAFTPTATPNLAFLGQINTPTATTTYVGQPFDVAAAFGGTMPKFWGIAVQNNNGGVLDATEGNFEKSYQGITFQSA